MFEPDRRGRRIGPVWLTPGIRPGDAAALLAMVITNISMITYFTFMQPYILTEVLHVPAGRQGVLTGTLGSMQELISLLLMGVVGAFADTAGRRRLAAVGFSLVALGFLLYPLVGAEWQLYLVRAIYGIGVAIVPVVTTAAVVAYVQETSRGKWSSMVSVCNSLTIVFVTVVMSRIPAFLTGEGLAAVEAARYTYWTGALISVIAVPLAWRRLKDSQETGAGSSSSPFAQLRRGVAMVRGNPRLPVAYAAGLIGRGDLIVVSTFISLWVAQVGIGNGVGVGPSMARAGMVFGAVQMSALLWAPIMGVIVDRLDRVTALALAMGLAAAGYGLMGQVADPFSNTVFAVAVLLGIGENAVLIASIALVGQETPRNLHGTSIGLFLVGGAVGVILANSGGGYLFDHWSKTGPFTLMGVLNGLILVWALVVRWRVGRPIQSASSQESQPSSPFQ